MNSASISLPGGAWLDGLREQSATVRALTGHEEEWAANTPSQARAATSQQLLEQCVVELAGRRPPATTDLLHLTVGDREALLWHIYRQTYGATLDLTLNCGSCGTKLDLNLTVDDLLEPHYAVWEPTFAHDALPADAHYRLPTGADLIAVFPLPEQERGLAVLRRCVVDWDMGPHVSKEVATQLGDAMAARDPQAETELLARCIDCGQQISAWVDACATLVSVAAAHTAQLLHQIHALAWYYHWNESDILSLPPQRRLAYLDLIDASLEDTRR